MDDRRVADVCYGLFRESGKIGYWLLYKKMLGERNGRT